MPPSEDSRQRELRARLCALGFDAVRFASIGAPVPAEATSVRNLAGWLAAGMHGEMHWMERSLDKRLNPDLVLPGVRSIIGLGVTYSSDRPRAVSAIRSGLRWARYSLYEDYHDTIKPGLEAAGLVMEQLYGISSADYRYYVDTGPVVDRGWAARAGIGFVGKNAMLISRAFGNWLFLAAILTRLDLQADDPVGKGVTRPAADSGEAPTTEVSPPEVGVLCGKCTRCLDACPTAAFAAPGVVDARRCISYHTIENKGVIPRDLRAGIGNHIYGCDVCLEVCPWNRFARRGREMLLASRTDIADVPLRELLQLTPERFAEVFRRTPIKRLKLQGLLRNACIVAGNSGDVSLLPELIALAAHSAWPLVRAHAVWAAYRLGGGSQVALFREKEADAIVLAEYEAEERSVA